MKRTALCLAFALCACSCVSLRGPSDLRRDIVKETGWELERESAFGMGRLPLRLLGRLVEEGDEDFSLRGLSRVEIGVYQLEAGSRGASLRGLEVKGLRPIVRVSEHGSDAAILVDDSERARELVVISRDDEEVVIVRVEGRVDAFLEKLFTSVADDEKGWMEATREIAEENKKGTG